MAKSSSRRDFLRGLAGGAARQAPGLAIGGGARLLRDAVTPQPARSAAEPATRPAAMPTALASVEQLLEIAADLGIGKGKARVWTCDLTHGYIDINGSYRS